MSCEELFLTQLRKRGFRLTPQREMVLVVLHHIGHPASAEEIFGLVAEKSASVERSTIYRTLDLLVSMQMVTVIDISEKQQRLFELVENRVPHLHLVCRACGKIIGVELDFLQPLMDQLIEEKGFHTDFSNLTLPGICKECEGVEKLDPAGALG